MIEPAPRIRLTHLSFFVASFALVAGACGDGGTPAARCLGPTVMVESPLTCRPPGGLPPEPPNEWDWLLKNECYAELLASTSTAIRLGSMYTPEAYLYRGLAQVATVAGPLLSQESLSKAEQSIDDLSTVDAQREKLLLYRGLMIVNAQLAKTQDQSEFLQIAEDYRDQGLRLACPDQVTAVETEFLQMRWDSAIK